MTGNDRFEPWLLTVEQAAKLLRIGRTKMYELIETEHLPVIRFGRILRVDPEDLRQWLMQRKTM